MWTVAAGVEADVGRRDVTSQDGQQSGAMNADDGSTHLVGELLQRNVGQELSGAVANLPATERGVLPRGDMQRLRRGGEPAATPRPRGA